MPIIDAFRRDPIPEDIAQVRESFAELLQGSDVVFDVLAMLSDIPLTANEIQENLQIESPIDSQLIRISVAAPNPQTATLIANTIVRIGIERYEILFAPSEGNAQIKEPQDLPPIVIHVITLARPPNQLYRLIGPQLIIMGVIGSILAGISLSFFLKHRSTSK